MNRREAIAALGLTGVASIACLAPKADEVLVIETDRYLTLEMMHRIRDQVKEIFPNQRVLVLDPSMRLKIAKTSTVTS